MVRIFHNYTYWECWKNGFFNQTEIKSKKHKSNQIIKLFSSEKITEEYMRKVLINWPISCEQNLSNKSMNRIAWLGQAACCLYTGASCFLTMNVWNSIDKENQKNANNIANLIIKEWEQNLKSKNILNNGKKGGIQMEYQMKFQFS